MRKNTKQVSLWNFVIVDGEIPLYLDNADSPAALCLAWMLLKKYTNSIFYIPSPTLEMILYALDRVDISLWQIPESLRTYEVCRKIVEKDYVSLSDIPENLRDSDLYDVALAKDPRAIAHIQLAHLTKERCLVALRKNGMMIRHVPKAKLTKQLWREAIKQTVQALEEIDIITPAMLREARKCHPEEENYISLFTGTEMYKNKIVYDSIAKENKGF